MSSGRQTRIGRNAAMLAIVLLALAADLVWAQAWRVDAWTSRAGLPSDSLNMVLPLQDGHLLVTSFYEPPTLFDGYGFQPLRLEGTDSELLRGASVAAQTSDGALWFGTRERGLVRVAADGSSNAIELLPQTPAIDVRTLTVGHAGALLIGTSQGLFVIDDPIGARSVRTPTSQHERLPISALLEDRSGRLWIGTDRGLYWRQAGRSERVDEPRLDTYIWSLHQDAHGALWVSTRGSGLARMDAGGWRYYDRRNGFPNDVARQVVDDGAGGVWAATSGGGLAHLVDGEVHAVVNSSNGLQGDTFYWLHRDSVGAIWAAGPGTGLNRIRPSAFWRWQATDGLASAFIWALHQDRSGRIWAGSNAGVSWRDGSGARVIGAAGPGYRAVTRSLLQTDENSMLVATEGGLFSLADDRFRLIDGTGDLQVWSLNRDAQGQIWAGGDRLWRVHGQRAEIVESPPFTVPDRIVAIYPDNGSLWLLTQRSGLWRRSAGKFEQLVGPEIGMLRAMWIDPDGRHWLAGTRVGWLGDDLRFHPLAAFQRAYGRGFHALLPDDQGGLWVPSNVGLFRFNVAELRLHAAGRAEEPVAQRFDLADGLTSTEFNGGGQSPAIAARDGSLWFATTNGVSRVNPAGLDQRRATLNPVITGIESDDGWSPPERARALPAGTRRVGIRYTALPAAVGGDATFAYRLLPLLRDWVDVGDSRSALFPALGPGMYRFEVRAILPGTGAPAAVTAHEFSIEPRLLERQGVRIGLLLALLLALSALPIGHIRALRRQRRKLLAEVAEKTLALERLASTDALTGLSNRRVFDAVLARALDAGGRPALLLFDVDHFKRYNDALGHQAGDQCLSSIGEMLTHVVRHENDLAARLGGEEFALLLQHGDLTVAAALAERVRTQLRDRGLAHPDSPVSTLVTVSIGYACAAPGESAESLYRRADQAMYQAKSAGRDRAVGHG
jgi:diguanylate cyclase (GGDEF)-like protein